MATSSLRDALVKKTSWTKQQLSARVQQLRKQLPMTTADAQAVIAHQERIKIDRYLDADALSRVQSIMAKLDASAKGNGAAGSGPSASRGKVPATKRGLGSGSPRSRTLIFPGTFTLADPLLPEVKLREAREMAAVYPVLYVLENSMREVVQRVMRAKYGPDWWDTALTGGKVKMLKTNSDLRRERELQTSWHQRRGAHPVDYIDLVQLGEIILAKQDDFFPGILGDNRQWFEQFMRELVPSRNVLCHMNPLSDHNIADVRLKAARWYTLITERRGSIP